MTDNGVITLKVSEVVYREDLYPRFEPDPATIQQYADSIEVLPAIEINQHNELIDGYHRWTAHKKQKAETIKAIVTQTKSDNEFLRLAIERNAKHGLQLNNAEKKNLALRLYTSRKKEKDEFAKLFSVDIRTIERWTSRRDKDLKEQRNKQIFEWWLAGETYEEIASEMGLDDKTPRNVVNDAKSGKNDICQKFLVFSNYQDPDWSPPLYNVWKQQNKSNKVNHPGNSEASFLDNLLYMYTNPFDIVVDPFGGGGSTIDVCKKRLRRYWVSDRLPIVERNDIREADILDGPPSLHKRWSDVALLYLDPPYWKQAEGKYSEDSQDLANMRLEEFYEVLTLFTLDCSKKMTVGAHIALLMQPTQWKAENKEAIDHVFDLMAKISATDNLKYKMRISCPYESQQCNAQQVQWAKENKQVLVINRELIIWEVIG